MDHDKAWSMNKALRRYFDVRAFGWDGMVGQEHGSKLESILTLFDFRGAACLLDVGCGTGVLFPLLATRVDKNAQIICLDISGSMLEAFRRKIESDPPYISGGPSACLVQGDLLWAPFRPSSFDWILCNSCFPHFHDQLSAVAAMSRLLKTNGMLLICHTQGREGINSLHRAAGQAVGGHELPTIDVLCTCLPEVGLEYQYGEDKSDRYILAAVKRS